MSQRLQNTTLARPSSIRSRPLRRLVIASHTLSGTLKFGGPLVCRKTDWRHYSYKNGSIIIASLQPSFQVLHTLTLQRAPSPIVNLAWHASSSKQKSDMLTSQMSDGDLRVWSIAKPAAAETPKAIRILKRGDNVEPGVNWSAWSKNGRVIQYQDGYV